VYVPQALRSALRSTSRHGSPGAGWVRRCGRLARAPRRSGLYNSGAWPHAGEGGPAGLSPRRFWAVMASERQRCTSVGPRRGACGQRIVGRAVPGKAGGPHGRGTACAAGSLRRGWLLACRCRPAPAAVPGPAPSAQARRACRCPGHRGWCPGVSAVSALEPVELPLGGDEVGAAVGAGPPVGARSCPGVGPGGEGLQPVVSSA